MISLLAFFLFIGTANAVSISSSSAWNALEIQTEAPYQITIDPQTIQEWETINPDNSTTYHFKYRGTFLQNGIDKPGTKYLGFSFDTKAKAGSYFGYRNFNTTDTPAVLKAEDFSYKNSYVLSNVTKYDYIYEYDMFGNLTNTIATPVYIVNEMKNIYYTTYSVMPKGTYKEFEAYIVMDSKPSRFIMYFGTGSTIIQLTKNGNLNVVVGENQTYGYVSNLRTADCTITTQNDTDTSLVGYWSFDDGTGYSIAHDGSRYENHGTLTNMNTVGNATSGWNTSGNISGALQFDGVDDYVNLEDPSTMNLTEAITISGWINSKSNAAEQLIVSKMAAS
ncbi:MAG: hypothetical protein ABIH42_05315, partial [Planctomycetota bacterium]